MVDNSEGYEEVHTWYTCRCIVRRLVIDSTLTLIPVTLTVYDCIVTFHIIQAGVTNCTCIQAGVVQQQIVYIRFKLNLDHTTFMNKTLLYTTHDLMYIFFVTFQTCAHCT